MTNLTTLSDDELHESAITAAQRDREAELDTIAHLREIERRRLHLVRGFSSIFSYAVDALGFSESAAATRVQAMRLAATLPSADAMLRSGELSVTTAATVQRFFRREEKENRNAIAPEKRATILREVAGKSRREIDRTLLAHATNPETHTLRESTRAVSATRTELTLYADETLMKLLERYRELKGAQKLEEILQTLLAKLDPGNRPAQATLPAKEDSRHVPVGMTRELHRRAGSQCEFIDPKTRRRCSSHYRLQLDHVQPFALGGPTALENLRLLCRPHNSLEAHRTYGEAKMRQFTRS
jgi:hypothetical protein